MARFARRGVTGFAALAALTLAGCSQSTETAGVTEPVHPPNLDYGAMDKEGVEYVCTNGDVIRLAHNPMGNAVVIYTPDAAYKLDGGSVAGSSASWDGFSMDKRVSLDIENASNASLRVGEHGNTQTWDCTLPALVVAGT